MSSPMPKSSIADLARGINAASAAALAAELGSQAALRDTGALPGPAPPSPMAEVEPPQPSGAESGLQLLQTLEGHTDRVWAVAWSPDGALYQHKHPKSSSQSSPQKLHSTAPAYPYAPQRYPHRPAASTAGLGCLIAGKETQGAMPAILRCAYSSLLRSCALGVH